MTLKKRILLTGGSGKAGKHVAKQLLDKGYRVLNCDLVNHQQEGLDYLHLDVTNAGQVFNALSCHFNRDELRQNKNVIGLDAVVHFAAVPRVLLKPDDETYRINVLGTYNVIEAAVKLGIKKLTGKNLSDDENYKDDFILKYTGKFDINKTNLNFLK